MNVTIIPERLRELRESQPKKMSQALLARQAKIGKRQVQRIEQQHGPISVRQLTLERLARALSVKPQVLTGEAPMPLNADEPQLPRAEDFRELRVKLDPRVQLSYDLLGHRYGASIQDVLNIAPALFAWHAEKSLAFRKKRFEKKLQKVEEILELQSLFPKLQELVGYASGSLSDFFSGDGHEEQLSISQRDIFGETLSIDDGDPWRENPFSAYLRECFKDPEAGQQAQIVWPEGAPYSVVSYVGDTQVPETEVCRSALDELVCGNQDALFALKFGVVRIKDIPEELRSPERAAERSMWLAEKLQERKGVAQ